MSVGASGNCAENCAENQGEEEQEQQEMGGSLNQGEEECKNEMDETDMRSPKHPQSTMDQGCAKEVRDIRRMVEFLVHSERKIRRQDGRGGPKAGEVGKRESSQLKDEERETSLEQAVMDHTKLVKVIVDKWFVDKGYGFGKAPSGEVVFIHASVVQNADVLVVGTAEWTQLATMLVQRVYRVGKAWGERAWKEEKDKERASQAAQQVRRAVTLTAELAA